MKSRLQITLSLFLLCFISFSTFANPVTLPQINQKQILANAPHLNPQALSYAVKAYHWAASKGKVKNPNVLTIVDFNLPSYAKRMWVINLKNSQVLMNIPTTQGKNSGLVYAKHFSNQFNTDESSLGVYETLNSYQGEHGESMRLAGLEPGINNNAYRRDIVIHPAWYATPQFIKKYHRTGRSWGCFAVNPAISKKLVELTKDGSILFAYANQEKNDPIFHSTQSA